MAEVAAGSLYPAHWEADIVLKDGGAARLRPILPQDAGRLVAFYDRVSDESKYMRFFSHRPTLSEREVRSFTTVDYENRVALIVLIREEMVGVVRYERVDADGRAVLGSSPVAEIAFLVEDSHHRRGLASVMLEHLAAAAWERGIRRFVAEVLPANQRMITFFTEAGYSQQHFYGDDVVHLELSIKPTERSLAVTLAREHHAEARSIQRLLGPRSVVVIGASRDPDSAGAALMDSVLGGGFVGDVHLVNAAADRIGGRPAYRSVRDIPGPVDLALVALPAAGVLPVVEDCALKGIHALVVISTGFGEAGPQGEDRQHALVRTARGAGMRVVGPSALGIINTSPAVRLNATVAPGMPKRGRIGMFAQSGSLGFAVLGAAKRRGIGLSTFVSAGERVDVSGNDMLQYWEQDPETDVVLLHLETLGNPRKFTRIARRVSARKPIVAVKTGWHAQGVPAGHAARAWSVPPAAVDALFRQAGIIRVGSMNELFDVAQLLLRQPLPRGDRVGIVGNSSSHIALTADACVTAGLRPLPPVRLPFTVEGRRVHKTVLTALADPGTDAVILAFVSLRTATGEAVDELLADLAPQSTKPLLVALLTPDDEVDRPREAGEGADDVACGVPTYGSPQSAVGALAAVASYAQWRQQPVGSLIEPAGIAPDRVQALAAEVLDQHDGTDPIDLTHDQIGELLEAYGIRLWSAVPAPTAEAAATAAAELGYPVALKTAAEQFRHRVDLGGVRLNLADETALRQAHAELCAVLGGGARARLVVQAMTAPGVAMSVGVVDEPSFGSLISFSVADPASELLHDPAYQILPATDVDLARLIHRIRASPLLFGYRGRAPADTGALHDLLARVARLADDLPELVELKLEPVVVATNGLAVLDAEARLMRAPHRPDRSRTP